jgi:hypothetical protein
MIVGEQMWLNETGRIVADAGKQFRGISLQPTKRH